MKNLEVEIVIIGSGGGMAAAIAAVEEGVKDILVIEKQRMLGGNTGHAYALFACESPVQERANIVTNRDEYFEKAMKWAHWSGVNPRLVRAYIDKSGDTIRWIEEKGVTFDLGISLASKNQHPVHVHSPVGGGRSLMKALVKKSKELGVKTMLHTSAKKLLRGARGNMTGVVAETKGEEFTIKANAVIIATGSFSGNREMLMQYCPDFTEDLYLLKWPFHAGTGDGIIMAAEAGAAIATSIPIFHVGPVPQSGPWGNLVAVVRYPYTVWVNKRGERFIDEAGYGVWECGNAILSQPGKIMYTIFDDGIRQKMEEEKLFSEEGWAVSLDSEEEKVAKSEGKFQQQVDRGKIKKFDTLKELAQWIGAKPPALQATVNEYNNACTQGRDPIFAKDRPYLMPLSKPPYYGIKCLVDSGETMGGIKVNEYLEVLDKKDKVIPGLYVSGVVADGWSGQTYPSDDLSGSAFAFSINSGRIAGESAARFMLRNGK